jgi:hypothetical protein
MPNDVTGEPEENDEIAVGLDTSWIPPEQAQIYKDCLGALLEAHVPFILAGAFALYAYTGIQRNTKDLDVFLPAEHVKKALLTLGARGFRTEVRDGLWLAKAHKDIYFIDLIFANPNKEIQIDMGWVRRSRRAQVFGMTVPLLALEELIISKLYVTRRDRFDGADIAHLILGSKGQLDWKWISRSLGKDQSLLLWYFVFFQYVYPGHVHYLPASLMDRIYESMVRTRSNPPPEKTFRGMLVDPVSFQVDCLSWGYEDVRDTQPLVDEHGGLM